VVTHLHSHCLCSLRKFGCNDAVELRGGMVPADMVMHRDDVGRIVEHPETHDVPSALSASLLQQGSVCIGRQGFLGCVRE